MYVNGEKNQCEKQQIYAENTLNKNNVRSMLQGLDG
jgi:hypothetical protein